MVSTSKLQVGTLATEVKKFAEGLPYWAKYLAKKVLSNNVISENDIDTSYSCLLEELGLIDNIENPEIVIKYNAVNSGNYKLDLLLLKLENVEGVNALTENQTIEFSPNLTILYGTNGSGKSGYIRLLKQVFYSKAPEEILPNVHIESEPKPINAKFTFKSDNEYISLEYPAHKNTAEFEQFAVFDRKSVLNHLEKRNEFEFRPAGLSFFADYTEAIKRVEQKLNSDITGKQSPNEFEVWFDEKSEIRTLIMNLSAATKIEELKKFTPFTDEDKDKKDQLQKQYDELLLISKGKEKEIKKLEKYKKLIGESKKEIEELNQYFTKELLDKIKNVITDCISKEATSKLEGIENFKTDKIEGIGTEEWKKFIESAEAFAKKQKPRTPIHYLKLLNIWRISKCRNPYFFVKCFAL